MDELENVLHWLTQFPSPQRLEMLMDAAKTVGLDDLLEAIELYWKKENE